MLEPHGPTATGSVQQGPMRVVTQHRVVVAGAVVEAVAMIVAGIIAVAADDDIGIGDLAVERDVTS